MSVTRFDVPEAESVGFSRGMEELLGLLAAQPGFLRGSVGRAVDEPSRWVLSTEWDQVGSYRRGIGAYAVKLASPAVMAWSVPDPSAFEVLARVDDAQTPLAGPGERAR